MIFSWNLLCHKAVTEIGRQRPTVTRFHPHRTFSWMGQRQSAGVEASQRSSGSGRRCALWLQEDAARALSDIWIRWCVLLNHSNSQRAGFQGGHRTVHLFVFAGKGVWMLFGGTLHWEVRMEAAGRLFLDVVSSCSWPHTLSVSKKWIWC